MNTSRPGLTRLALSISLLAAGLCLSSNLAWAQPDGSRLIISPMGSVNFWSERSDNDTAVEYGGMIGVQLNHNIAIEAGLRFGQAESLGFADRNGALVDTRSLGFDLRYHPFPKHRINWYVAAGWAESRFEPTNEALNGDYSGWEFGAGAILPFKGGDHYRASLRLDVRDMWLGFRQPLPDDHASNIIVSAGLQVEFGDNWHRDTDMDGVIDRFDACPKTDTRIVIDDKGCPIDTDGDGVFDGLDQCNNTLTGAVIDDSGCAIDSDGDGIFDGLDKCDNSPDGAHIDGDGCPTDADADGIFDGLDSCNDTPAGVRVDAKGCPSVDSDEEQGFYDTGLLVLPSVEFESNKAELKATSYGSLEIIGSMMKKWPSLVIEIGGHTDDRGSDKRNAELSQERADAVRTYLIGKFAHITEDRLTAVGYGEATPVADNATEEGRKQNRRVEAKRVSGGPGQ